MAVTALQQLLDKKITGGLNGFVSARRERGMSWHAIAVEVFAESGVVVTGESLRNWYMTPGRVA